MKNNTNILLQDSVVKVQAEKDTLVQNEIKSDIDSISTNSFADTLRIPLSETTKPDSIILQKPAAKIIPHPVKKKPAIEKPTEEVKTDSIQADNQSGFHLFEWEESGFDYKPHDVFIAEKSQYTNKDGILAEPHHYSRSQFNWTIFIGFISLLLLLILKTFFQKFLTQVISTVVNRQLADKLFREKSAFARKAFLLLNINYFIIFPLFLLQLSVEWHFSTTGDYLYDYFIITGVLLSVSILKIIVMYSAGIMLESITAIMENIHILYLINKSLGLFLLPIVYIIIYTPEKISQIGLYTGLGIVCISVFLKIIRGFRIIIKNGVLIFYSILYLCTLELLPYIIGSKLLMSLR